MRTTAETLIADDLETGLAPQAHVVALAPQRYTLHLCGPLAAGWSGALAREVATRRISILRGWARRTTSPCACAGGVQRPRPDFHGWEARFELHALDRELNLFEIDFLALARSATVPRRLTAARIIDDYELLAGRDGLEVAIRAPDGVGLLQVLLSTFASYALYPHEMTIETRGGVAHDLFRLQRAAGGRPSDIATASLRATLRKLMSGGRRADREGGSRPRPR